MLRLVLEGNHEVDLSPFDSLSSEQILDFSRLLAKDASSRIKLSLPDLENSLTAEDMRTLLRESERISELRIGQHRIAKLQDAVDAISGSRVDRFTSSEMYLRGFFKATQEWLHDYRYASDGRGLRPKLWQPPLPELPRAEQCPIVQLVLAVGPVGKYHTRLPTDDGVPWSSVLTAQTLDSMERPDTLVSLPLGDAFLSPADAVAKLPAFFSRLVLLAPMAVSFEIGRAA